MTHLLEKGNYKQFGAAVQPDLPASFHKTSESADAPRTRLDLARWIVDRNNPLTARVAVNRFWASSSASGSSRPRKTSAPRAHLPSHPELLDWLAVEFMADGWDMKALLKRIVTSATYRQSSTRRSANGSSRRSRATDCSRASPAPARSRDGPRPGAGRQRAAESASRRAVASIPPQPRGLWQAAFNGERTWPTSTGRRSSTAAAFTPSGGAPCPIRRWPPSTPRAARSAPSAASRTNTPLQAFVTLNDPVYVEAAQALARRIVARGRRDAGRPRRLTACKLVPGAAPQPRRRSAVLGQLYDDELAALPSRRSRAKALATEPLGPLPAGMTRAEAGRLDDGRQRAAEPRWRPDERMIADPAETVIRPNSKSQCIRDAISASRDSCTRRHFLDCRQGSALGAWRSGRLLAGRRQSRADNVADRPTTPLRRRGRRTSRRRPSA